MKIVDNTGSKLILWYFLLLVISSLWTGVKSANFKPRSKQVLKTKNCRCQWLTTHVDTSFLKSNAAKHTSYLYISLHFSYKFYYAGHLYFNEKKIDLFDTLLCCKPDPYEIVNKFHGSSLRVHLKPGIAIFPRRGLTLDTGDFHLKKILFNDFIKNVIIHL